MSKLYADIRSDIKSGDLLVWSDKNINSFTDIFLHLVRIFTKSEYTHVGIAWVISDRVFVIEAVIPAVRIYPLSKRLPFYHIATKAKWSDETEVFALEQVGYKYSIKQAIQSLFNKPNTDDNWQCVELSHDILLKDGIDLGPTYTPSTLVQKAMETFDGIVFVQNHLDR